METKVNFNVLDCIEKIYKHSKDSHLKEPLFDVLKEDLKNLSLEERQSIVSKKMTDLSQKYIDQNYLILKNL